MKTQWNPRLNRYVPLKRKKTLIPRHKCFGELNLFAHIWATRDHVCSNRECKKQLPEEPSLMFFSHIKPKSLYPELRLDENNIELLCADCHCAKHGIKLNH